MVYGGCWPLYRRFRYRIERGRGPSTGQGPCLQKEAKLSEVQARETATQLVDDGCPALGQREDLLQLPEREGVVARQQLAQVAPPVEVVQSLLSESVRSQRSVGGE